MDPGEGEGDGEGDSLACMGAGEGHDEGHGEGQPGSHHEVYPSARVVIVFCRDRLLTPVVHRPLTLIVTHAPQFPTR